MMGLHTLFMVAGLLGAIGALFAAPILWLGRRRIEWEAWMLLTPRPAPHLRSKSSSV